MEPLSIPRDGKKEVRLQDTWTSATHSATFSSGVVLLAEAGLPSEWESLLDDETGLCGEWRIGEWRIGD